MITSVHSVSSELLPDFDLEQNYPNPFNPITKIQFTIPRFSYVTLKVYNTLGEEVAMLLSENLPAGRYQVGWNAEKFAAGAYYYRISAGDFVMSKKMAFMK